MDDIPPNNNRIAEALGDITQLPKDMKIALTNKIDESFQPVPKPSFGDWLGNHEEKRQTMKLFECNKSKAVPRGT
ncbi:unnamed protein product [Rotaria sp. Silwood2]|nr:unnamed protein product [Rotaria sp. Silwood2]